MCSSIRDGRNIRMVLPLILAVFFCGLIPSGGMAASALRSRVYGFRHTDNKLAIQLANQLELKVTIDIHSPSVAVLTGTDSLELVRAYSLMEIADRKEPVSLKVLGSVSDSEAEETIKQLHKQLGGLNVGTFLDPPTKSVANPFIVDVYQGGLIVIAAAGEMEKAEEAYKTYQAKQEAQRPKAALSEPNRTEPNVPTVGVAEPNTAPSASLLMPQTQPVNQAAEPNEPHAVEAKLSLPQLAAAVEEAIEMAAPEEIKPAAEPNQTTPEEPQSQEDFMSSELLKSLAVEEKAAQQDTPTAVMETSETETIEEVKTQTTLPVESKAETVEEVKTETAFPVESKTETVKEAKAQAELSSDRPALPGTVRVGRVIPTTKPPTPQPLQPVDANAVEEPAGETKEVDFKKTVEQLIKQSAEEEKKALQEAATAETEAATAKIEAATAKTEAATAEIEAATAKAKAVQKPEKPAATPTKPKDTSSEQKVKTVSDESAVPQGDEELELTITLPEKVEIKQLIELVGKQLGLNYIYDEAKVRGDVMLKVHDGKIKVKDCYALLETVLRFKGFVMTRRGNLVTIVPSTELPASDPKIRTAGEPIEPGDVIINSIYALKHINYNTAMTLLRQLSLGTTIIPIAETNTLIITDYSYRMDKIEQVLQILDVPGVPKTYTYRSLQYMQAAELIPRLQKLASQLENLSITASTSSAPVTGVPVQIDPRTRQPIPQPSVSQSAPQQEQTVFLEADERTNRILMIGNEDQLKTVNTLIDSLDVRLYNLRYVKEYEIKYVDASEVINVLNELSLVKISTSQSTGQTGRTAQTTPQRPGMTPQQLQAAQQAAAQRAAVSGGAGATEGVDQPFVSIRPNTNSLLVNATEEQHEDIQLVIQYIDVEQKDQRTIKEYEIQNVDVQEVVQTLGDLGIISKESVSNITSSKSSLYSGTSRTSGSMTNRVTGMPMDQGAPEQTAVASLLTAEGGTVKELITTEPQMSILESTNSLLIHATPRQHASIALVIAHVDRELDRTSTPYVVYPLENQDPEELVVTLTDLIEGTMSKTAIPGSPAGSAGNKIQTEQTGVGNLPKKEEERIRVIPDPMSYSLIVYANKKNQQWIATLIEQLDEYRPQVLLDCKLVEITKQDDFTLDLNVMHSVPSLTNTSGLTGTISGSGVTAITKDTILTKLNTAGVDRNRFIDMQSDSGSFTGFYGDDKIMALLTAMQTKKYGRILANPKLLVDDNREGSIETKLTTYIERKTTNITDQGSGSNPIQTENVEFEPYDEKVNLKIKPHISKGDNLRLEIELVRSDFVDYSAASTKPPNNSESNVKTVVTVPNSSTIILGGLDKTKQQKGGSKVPLLGDIPLLGGLFRTTANTSDEKKLYIFVKPHILRPGENMSNYDMKKLSDRYRDEFEKRESEMQTYQDWPGLDSKPMTPVKVLEEDEEKTKTGSDSVTAEIP